MNRQSRLWILRTGGLIGGVLILLGTIKHMILLAVLGGIWIVGMGLIARQWLKDNQ